MSSADPSQLKVVTEISRKDVLFSLARIPESSQLLVGSSDFKVYALDVSAEKPEPREFAGHASYVTGIVLLGDQCVSGSWDGRLIWWDLENGEAIRTIDAHTRWIRDVNLTPDGKTIVTVADDMVCRLWDAESGALRNELRGHEEKTPHHFPSMLFCTAVSPDGRLLATADKTGHIVVWELASGKPLQTLEAPTMYTWDPKQRIHSIGGVRSLAFSPDSRLLAAGGMGQVGNIDHLGALARVEVFEWEKGEKTHEFPGDKFKGLVEQLRFAPDGRWLLAAGGDHSGFIKFFDLGAKKILHQDKAPMHVHDLALSESQDTIYAVGHQKLVVWQFPSAPAEAAG